MKNDNEKRVKRALLADIRRRPPTPITSRYTDAEGNFLEFGVVKLSGAGVRAVRQYLDADGKAVDEAAVNRTLVRFCVADPPLTDAAVDDLEAEDGIAWGDLIAQISTVNGFSAAAREEAKATFPSGDGGPPETPPGS